MLSKLLYAGDNKVLSTGRILLGILLVAQGGRGVLGWFGGPNPAENLDAFLRLIGLPAPLVWLAVATDFVAGTGLVFGLFTRIDAFFALADAIVGVVLRGIDLRLYTDWSATQGGVAIGYFVLTLVFALILISRGAGAFSLDRVLLRKVQHKSQRFSNSRMGPERFEGGKWAPDHNWPGHIACATPGSTHIEENRKKL